MNSKVKWTVDRFEGDYAIVELEDQSTADIPVKALPQNMKEGDIIILSVDRKETQQRKNEIDSLANRLFK